MLPTQIFDRYLNNWGLSPDGVAIETQTSLLLPVLKSGELAMLKLCLTDEESRGSRLLEQWAGVGAARVFARDEFAVVMERASGRCNLAAMARGGDDDTAGLALCDVAQRLHDQRPSPTALRTLESWFRALRDVAAAEGGLLSEAAKLADELLGKQRDIRVLHGDLHHGNVLDFGARGWLAIDPKGLVGERAFDYVALFSNPDLIDPTVPVAADPARFRCRVSVVAEAAGLERPHLLQWIFVGMALSASWFIADGDQKASIPLTIAELARAELNR